MAAEVSLPVSETCDPPPGPPRAAGRIAVGVGGGVAQDLEGVAARGEVLRPVG